MKQNIKIFVVALIIGMVAAFIFCYKFDDTIISNAIDAKVTYFYVGAYNNLNDASAKQKDYSTSIIYNSNGIYKIVIGVYTSQESIDLMTSYFLDKGVSFRSDTLKVNSQFLKNCKSYEPLIKTSNKDMYQNINNSLLQLFNEYIK